VVDAQMPGNTPMSIGRMRLVYRLNLRFQGEVLDDLSLLAINVFTIDTQCLRPETFVFGSADYFDFF
jgi:hypothetical protein